MADRKEIRITTSGDSLGSKTLPLGSEKIELEDTLEEILDDFKGTREALDRAADALENQGRSLHDILETAPPPGLGPGGGGPARTPPTGPPPSGPSGPSNPNTPGTSLVPAPPGGPGGGGPPAVIPPSPLPGPGGPNLPGITPQQITAVATGFLAIVEAGRVLANTFQFLNGIVQDTIDELRRRDPDIALASARQRVSEVQSQFLAARENSDELVGFLDAQTELLREMREFRTQVIELFGPLLTVIVRILSSLLDIITGLLSWVVRFVKFVFKLTKWADKLFDAIDAANPNRILRDLREIERNRDRPEHLKKVGPNLETLLSGEMLDDIAARADELRPERIADAGRGTR